VNYIGFNAGKEDMRGKHEGDHKDTTAVIIAKLFSINS
jgi:hypothetical protein